MPQGLRNLAQAVRLGDEDDTRYQAIETALEVQGVTGRDQNWHRRMQAPNLKGEIDAVERSRHPHIGEEHVEVAWVLEQLDCLVAIPCLDDVELFLLKEFGYRHADDAFILDEKYSPHRPTTAAFAHRQRSSSSCMKPNQQDGEDGS